MAALPRPDSRLPDLRHWTQPAMIRFKTRTTFVLAAVVALTPAAYGLLYLIGYAGSSTARVKREHGVTLPPSARKLVCRGDAWMHQFMDSGAAAAFEIPASDLPGFVSQLRVRESSEGSPLASAATDIFPANRQYQIDRPWISGVPLKRYRCVSPTGDWLSVQIWEIDDGHVGVLLYTDWN